MFLAWRELKKNKLRYGLVSLIMILLSFLVIMITGLANGLSYDNASFIKKSNFETFAIHSDAEKKILRSQLADEKVEKLTKDDQNIPFHLNLFTLQKEKDEKKVDVAILASPKNASLQTEITEGKAAKTTGNEIVVDEKLKQKGISLHDTLIEPNSKQEFKVVGFTKNASFSHAGIVFMSEEKWEEIAFPNQKQYNAVAMKSKPTSSDSSFEIVEKKDIMQNIPGYKEEQGTLLMIVGFLLTISVLLITVFFYVITLQKTKEIGVLKAIGTNGSYLGKSLIVQSILISVFAFAISWGLLALVQQILPASMPFLIENQTIAIYGVAFIVISIVGTLISLIPILKTNPLDAIRGGE